jgi:hypothetical protein
LQCLASKPNNRPSFIQPAFEDNGKLQFYPARQILSCWVRESAIAYNPIRPAAADPHKVLTTSQVRATLWDSWRNRWAKISLRCSKRHGRITHYLDTMLCEFLEFCPLRSPTFPNMFSVSISHNTTYAYRGLIVRQGSRTKNVCVSTKLALYIVYVKR